MKILLTIYLKPLEVRLLYSNSVISMKKNKITVSFKKS